MKQLFLYITIILAMLFTQRVTAQVYNAGQMYIPPGGVAAAFGNITNADSGNIINAGYIYANYNIDNHGTTGYDGGSLFLTGTAVQLLTGTTTFNTSNLIFNNSSGFTLSKRYSVAEQAIFVSGMVTAANSTEPLEFNPGGTGGPAVATTGVSDTTHVNGYAFQKGTGSFVYPVGDAVKYEPIAADLSANSSGMLCNYIPADAGYLPYLTTGLSSTPILHYNRLEYWDLKPSGTATGAVTVYYDTYNNTGIGADYDTTLVVAHKVATGWNNEGGIVSGTQIAGTTTTIGSISSWSPFTLGTISDFTFLPIRLDAFTAVEKNCTEILSWHTESETEIAAYDVQYSTDGVAFATVGTVSSKGNNSYYSFTYAPEKGRGYYRLRIREHDGSYTYSSILATDMKCNAHSIAVYPNPVAAGGNVYVTLAGYTGKVTAILYDVTGRWISNTDLSNGKNTVQTDILAAGNYELAVYSVENGREVYKIMITQ
ncbi:T9SS type A sorting domain-containing protein [Chitinophagaceae bacterium MMS25-I14]